jgi:ABC-type multidrug transport system ATPase subunit
MKRAQPEINPIPGDPYAELRGVSVYGDGNPLIQDISLAVHAGEMVELRGPNGSGKSTILRTFALVEPVGTPDVKGGVILFGHDMTTASHATRRAIMRAHVGVGFQKPELPSALKVYQHLTGLNAMLGIEVDKDYLEKVVDSLGLSDKLDSPIAPLSGGEKQRLDLARTALKRPKLWVLDEPTSAVDTQGKRVIFETIREFCNDGAAAIVVSHDLQVADYTDRVVLLDDGHILSEESR